MIDKVDELETEEITETEPKKQEEKKKEKVEFSKEQQDLFDSLINKKMAKFKQEEERKIELAKQEGERMASLSAEEKAKELLKIKEEKALEREKNLKIREMLIETKDQMEEVGLPKSMAKLMISDTAEETMENIKNFKVEFDSAVEREVLARLKGGHKPIVSGEKLTEVELLEKQMKETTKMHEKLYLKNKIEKLKNGR